MLPADSKKSADARFKKEKNTEEKFDKIFYYISKHEEFSQKIFFDGQIYDALYLLPSAVIKYFLITESSSNLPPSKIVFIC